MLGTERSHLMILSLLLSMLYITSAAKLRCYDGTITNFKSFSLERPRALLKSACFQSNRKTWFYAHHFGGGPNSNDVTAIVKAFLKQKRVNIILLDWEEEASTPGGSLINARRVGEQFGRSVILLKNNGLKLTLVHLVGNGIGAQLMSVSGRRIKGDGEPVRRITGLDPASLISDIYVAFPIVASDAVLVDVLHTDTEGQGSLEADATVDIWANCNRQVQPGCRTNIFQTLLDGDTCSHNRAWMYFNETILNPNAFQVRIADNCIEWRSGFGGSQTFFWGENFDTNTFNGNFYFETSSTSPYGLGAVGSQS